MSSGLFEVELYGGLFMFMGYIVFDTQVPLALNLLDMRWYKWSHLTRAHTLIMPARR